MTGLVIFDLDGVLIDSEVIAGPEYSRHRDLGRRRDYTGRQAQDIVSLVTKNYHIAFPDGFTHELEGMILADLLAELKPVRGIANIPAHLDGTPWCVASNSGHARITRCLAAAGLTPLFAPSLFSAEMAKRGKPAPDVYLYAAGKWVSKPPRASWSRTPSSA